MKVLSYLEMINDNDDYHFEFLKFMESKGFSIIGNQYYKGVAKFYSQPFKPELITELFEGWEKSKDTDIILSYSDKDYIIFWQKSIPSIMNVDYKDNNKSLDIQEYWTPCRLNDFINDCQQAGIELEWRQK